MALADQPPSVAEAGGLHRLAHGLQRLPAGGRLVDGIDLIVNWSRANSLWPLVYGTSCCAIEMMATVASRNDLARFGSEVFRASPRQADLIILAGTLTEKMSDHLLTLYEQMPDPKYVIAMGACTISGGPFIYGSYSVIRGADRVIPVDVFVPGCPPRPEALLHGLMELQGLIRRESVRRLRQPPALETCPSIDRWSADAAAWEEEEAQRQAELEPLRAQWKAEHPDYKPPKPERSARPDLPQVERQARPRVGLAPSRILSLVHQRFPQISVHDCSELAELDQDCERTLELVVSADRYVALVGFLRAHAEIATDLLLEITAIDRPDRIEVLVHLLSLDHKHKVFVRCSLDREQPRIDTLAGLFAAADWHEREVAEMFGVVFRGHPDPRRLFLPKAMQGFPLRKDFSDPERVLTRVT